LASEKGVRMIKASDVVTLKAEWMDKGDENITFIAVYDECKGRVTVQAQLGLPINPTQVVDVSWIEGH
jgi:hypothetical protein